MLSIEAIGIQKSFGKKKVLNSLDLNVKKGSIHAILGPNGSGKTTFIKILSTLIKAEGGHAKIAGYDINTEPDKVRESISLTGQNASVDEELTGYENLYMVARLRGFTSKEAKQRANELLNAFELIDSGKKLVKTYSGGMRRKLDIAASIVRLTEIMFLDEPTTGLDPRSRNSLWAIIRGLAKQGTTILLTTQYLEEAEHLADRITVIDDGRVISEGTSDELKTSIGNNILHVHVNGSSENEKLASVLAGFAEHAPQLDTDGKKIAFPVAGQEQAISILGKLQSSNVDISGFSLSRPDLNEVFMALTGKVAGSEEEDENGSARNPDAVHQSMSISSLIDNAQPVKQMGFLSNKFIFGWRNLLKIKHIPEQFVDVLITPIMFTFMFTYIFGGALAGSTKDYLQFFIPGILVQTLTFNAMYAGLNISNDISKGIFDRFKSMPIWQPAPLSGIFIGDFFRHLISGLLVLLFGFILGFRPDASILAFVLSFIIMIVFAMSIAWIFIIMGLTMRSTSAVLSIGWIILMPLVFMSNIFADPATMPGWLQSFISYNPLAWQVDAVRGVACRDTFYESYFNRTWCFAGYNSCVISYSCNSLQERKMMAFSMNKTKF